MTNNESKPSGNFIIQCIYSSIIDESCILGTSVLIISIILLMLSILALYKMTRFYKKMNFENTIILLSILQTIIMQLVLISLYDIFFESFFLLQIFIISLIIRKFRILAKEPKTFFDKNGFFIILNVLNVLIFCIYPFYLNIFKGHHLYVKLFYRIFHAITTCILSYYCCFFIKLAAKYKENYIDSYYFFYEVKISDNDNNDKNEDNDNIDNNDNTDSNIENLNNNDKDKDKEDINDENDRSKSKSKILKKEKKGEVFYHKKKKQISYLYIVNLFCAFIEICFTITRNFILHNHYLEDDYRTIPNTTSGDIIYYFYLIVCFCNVSVNYLCFYFYIRRQYSKNPKKYKKDPKKKILDEKFIEKEENIKNNNNPDVNKFLFSSSTQNKDEEPVEVKIQKDENGRNSLEFPDFGSGNSGNNNNELLPEESPK